MSPADAEPDGGRAGMAAGGNGGATEPDGGSAGSNPTGAGENAGESGNGGAGGEESVGDGGAAPTSSPSHWFVFSRSDETFAYDTAKFPSATGLLPLNTGSLSRPVIWSPDGHWLLYEHGTDLYCVDMSGETPGAAMLLSAAGPGTSITYPALSWSADSKSVAMTKGGSAAPLSPQVLVFDPTHPSPVMHSLSDAAKELSWAPVGDRVLYQDSSGGHVRSVQAGVPGPEILLAGDSFFWSPDGNAVAAVTNGINGKLTLTDVTQTTPTPVTLSSASISWSTVEQLVFSPDGKSLLFAGEQIRDFERDIFWVRLEPTIEPPVLVSTGLTGNDTVSGDFSMSPDGKWVLYSVFDSNETTAWTVDLSGTKPGAPFKAVSMPIDASSWVPSAPEKFIGYGSATAAMLDAANPGFDEVSIANEVLGFSLSSRGAIAFGGFTGIFARDLLHPELPTSQLSTKSGPTNWVWSPDGDFIVVVEVGQNSQTRLIRWENSTATNEIALGTVSGVDWLKWQPSAD